MNIDALPPSGEVPKNSEIFEFRVMIVVDNLESLQFYNNTLFIQSRVGDECEVLNQNASCDLTGESK